MSISVLKPGLMTTIQDGGRYGCQKIGIVVSGAMDLYDMNLANIAVGNKENEGVLEITMIGPQLKIDKGEVISITGADISPSINKKKVPMGRPVYISKDSVLDFGRCENGCRAYMAIAGGFDIDTIMGSVSTYVRGGLGGIDGRALKKGDVISTREKSELNKKIMSKIMENKDIHEKGKDNSFYAPSWYIRNYCDYGKKPDAEVIRVFEDMQFDKFSSDSLEKFFSSEFTIDSRSDRMGYRIKGSEIKLKDKLEMISGEVSFGTIQIPPDGNPIILLADRATAGGYPKIAHVCSFDIQRLVQLKPSEKIRFKKIDIKDAERLYIERREELEELKKSIELISI